MIIKKIKIPLYYGKLTIIQAKDLKRVQKKYKLMSTYGCEAFAFRMYNKKGVSSYFLAFENKTTPDVIAHEALHLVALIYEDISAILEIENDEPQCYLLGWIVSECHKFLKVKKIK